MMLISEKGFPVSVFYLILELKVIDKHDGKPSVLVPPHFILEFIVGDGIAFESPSG